MPARDVGEMGKRLPGWVAALGCTLALAAAPASASNDDVDAGLSNNSKANRLAAVQNQPAFVLRARDVQRHFDALNISLSDIRRGAVTVPPLFMPRFATDLPTLESAKLRKKVFIQTVLPLILQANAEVARERWKLDDVLGEVAKGRAMSGEQRLSLENLAQKYGVDFGDWSELRLRVREVPVSLALAQGAEESGWGTSRFARQGNAVFGQRTFSRGRGIVPREREAGEKYEVLRFGALLTSVRAYLWNLNTHFAYADFRAARAQGHARGGKPDSMSLIATLKRYSERGEAYIETIRTIIRFNRLRQFDDARLAGTDKSI